MTTDIRLDGSGADVAAEKPRWVLCMCLGRTFVGEPHLQNGTLHLAPVFELQSAGAQTERGFQVMCTAVPVLWMPSILSMPVPQGAVLIPENELSREDVKRVDAAIAQGVQIAEAVRAAGSGISLAPAGMKMPPIVPRRH